MICSNCAAGADYISKSSDNLVRIAYAPSVARQLHSACEGCDCQHRVQLQLEGRSVRK